MFASCKTVTLFTCVLKIRTTDAKVETEPDQKKKLSNVYL